MAKCDNQPPTSASSAVTKSTAAEREDTASETEKATTGAQPNASDSHRLLVEAEDITLAFGDKAVFSNISFVLRKGEHLALLGPNGAGKSTLFRFLQGDLRPVQNLPGRVIWHFGNQQDSSPLSAKEHVRLVSPAQQRNYVRQGWKVSGEEIILSGLDNANLLYGEPSAKDAERAANLADAAGALHLLSMHAPAMSQGQLRLCLILRALASRPELLLLDEPFDGLDSPSRQAVRKAMRIATEEGSTLLVSAHRKEDVPDFIRQALIIHQGALCRSDVEASGAYLEDTRYTRQTETAAACAESRCIAKNYSDAAVCAGDGSREGFPAESRRNAASPGHDRVIPALNETSSGHNAAPPALTAAPGIAAASSGITSPGHDGAALLELSHVDVFIDRKQVLFDLSWSARPGEQWIISGRNGSGKSTLLRLLYGEEFAAYGGSVFWHGQPRPGLDELHAMVGYVSDRLQDVYDYDLTAEEVVVSGLRGHIGLYEEADEASLQTARFWLDRMEMGRHAKTPFFSLSSGMARRVLLARALAGAPPVLLLDEPCTGLDATSRALFFDALSQLSQQGVSLFYVSHHEDDKLPIFTHELLLERGRIVAAGSRRG